jgi:hypothetical protein
MNGMANLKKRAPFIFFSIMLTLWVVSILAVYLPISPWSAQTFPKTIDAKAMNFFLTMTGISFATFLGMGLRGLSKPKLQKQSQVSHEAQ